MLNQYRRALEVLRISILPQNVFSVITLTLGLGKLDILIVDTLPSILINYVILIFSFLVFSTFLTNKCIIRIPHRLRNS